MSEETRKSLADIVERISVKDFAGAMDECRIILARDPNCAPALHMMGIVANYMRDQGLAISLVERAHQIEPDYREYPAVLAYLCAAVGRVNDSVYYAKLAKVLESHPDYDNLLPRDLPSGVEVFKHTGLSVHYLVAESAFAAGDYPATLLHCESELRINPENTDCMLLMARALIATGHPAGALAQLRAAVHLQPSLAKTHLLMGEALLGLGEHDLARASHEMAVSLDSPDPHESEAARQALASLGWQNEPAISYKLGTTITVQPRRATPVKSPLSPLIGVLWDNCTINPLADFVAPALATMDELVLYRLNHRGDAFTEALRGSVLRLQECQDLDVATLEQIVSGDRPCAFINLCGGGAEARYPIFTGAAPLSIQWLGQPMMDRVPETGLIISAPQTRKVDEVTFGANRLVTLPQLCTYRFPTTGVEEETIGDLPRDRDGIVTFGATGDMRRIHTETLALWARALWAVPGSVLILGRTSEWPNSVMEKILGAFANFGLLNRIRFQRLEKNSGINFSFYASIDILLDSAPVNGMNDIAEALWMGVPAVTLRGMRRAGCIGAAILDAAGRAEWIADNADSFATIVRSLAERPNLAALRSELRATTATSPLCDAKGFGKMLRDAIMTAAMVRATA